MEYIGIAVVIIELIFLFIQYIWASEKYWKEHNSKNNKDYEERR